MLRLGVREIARRVKKSPTTVQRVLEGVEVPFGTDQTKKQIFKAIEDEARTMKENLDRLRGFEG